jgi:hypothetical protein
MDTEVLPAMMRQSAEPPQPDEHKGIVSKDLMDTIVKEEEAEHMS